MIILPDKNVPRAKFLMPVHAREWRSPSLAQPKDQFGRENSTIFRVRSRLHDGHVVWQGCFRDRADFDAFMWAIANGTLKYERALWRLPTPHWHPDLDPQISYDFATLVFLVAPTGSNQTWTSPSDWDSSNNSIQTIGGGASGGAGANSAIGATRAGTGGGGGAWNRITNHAITSPGTDTRTYQIASGGAAVVASSPSLVNGNAGNDTWFGATSLASANVGSKGGSPGVGASGNASGGAGGVGASGVGSSSNNGGAGGGHSSGSGSGNTHGLGGGGAAGPNGAGNAGGSIATAGGSSSNGGSGDAGFGGSAGAGAHNAGAGNGGNGTEFDATHGSGGGGGGNSRAGAGTSTAGAGGNYGAGGGGAASNNTGSGTATSGLGRQGIIAITYTPLAAAPTRYSFNIPNQGM
jgi:hypothetical protein